MPKSQYQTSTTRSRCAETERDLGFGRNVNAFRQVTVVAELWYHRGCSTTVGIRVKESMGTFSLFECLVLGATLCGRALCLARRTLTYEPTMPLMSIRCS
jgi:hypothetical protein